MAGNRAERLVPGLSLKPGTSPCLAATEIGASGFQSCAITGILLLGGASERFGSPKALATFRGETLAERAWRVLHEVCDEVLAVGKEADGLELPFAVLDDGARDRAPVFGLIAALRAATNDLCLALPVDCPLVTPDLLHALAMARAVPPTGPLPGAYERTQLTELEQRVAGGELSLRGVNPRVLQADAKLLLNVNTRLDLAAAAAADWARERKDVRAVLVIGSQARTEAPADRWSDLDIVLFADDPAGLAADPVWVESFGRPVLTFLEPTAVGGQVERRVLYEDGSDVDFALFPAARWRDVAKATEAATVIGRGYRVLYDEVGIEDVLAEATAPGREALPDANAFRELASDFWYHALWTAKKLRRGEVFTAKGCLDAYMKAQIVTLLEWHARAIDPEADTWHGGRFLERWADPGALAALESAYARYDLRDVARALWETVDLFQGLEEETARSLQPGVELDHADLRRRIAAVVPDPRHASTLRP